MVISKKTCLEKMGDAHPSPYPPTSSICAVVVVVGAAEGPKFEDEHECSFMGVLNGGGGVSPSNW